MSQTKTRPERSSCVAASLAPPDRGEDTDCEALGANADEIRAFGLNGLYRRLKIIGVEPSAPDDLVRLARARPRYRFDQGSERPLRPGKRASGSRQARRSVVVPSRRLGRPSRDARSSRKASALAQPWAASDCLSVACRSDGRAPRKLTAGRA